MVASAVEPRGHLGRRGLLEVVCVSWNEAGVIQRQPDPRRPGVRIGSSPAKASMVLSAGSSRRNLTRYLAFELLATLI